MQGIERGSFYSSDGYCDYCDFLPSVAGMTAARGGDLIGRRKPRAAAHAKRKRWMMSEGPVLRGFTGAAVAETTWDRNVVVVGRAPARQTTILVNRILNLVAARAESWPHGDRRSDLHEQGSDRNEAAA